MIALLVFVCALAAVSGENIQFHSLKVDKREPVISSNLFVGNFTVRLDHFRVQDPRTVSFTYHANLNYFSTGAPFLIFLKHSGDYSTQWIEEGLMVDVARDIHGALFTFDIRYFGSNLPTENASFENLQYLTPEQILHDLASFIESIRTQHNSQSSRVVVWGSGYGGTLAAWARKKLPHLVEAAWSSSGIFEIALASVSVFDSFGYNFLRTGDIECRNTMQLAFEELDALVVAGDGVTIQEHLNLCHPIDTNDSNDVSFLFEYLFFMVTSYINNNHLPGFERMCLDLSVIPEDPLASFIRWLDYVYGNEECRNVSFQSNTDLHSNIEWNQPGTLSGRRQWAYLQCTQTGLFQITDSITWLPNRVEMPFHVRECEEILGPDYVFDRIRQANPGMINAFGSLDPSISNVIYTNGLLDAWLYHGIIYTFNRNSYSLNIEHVGRSADLPSIRTEDPVALVDAKLNIVEILTEWISRWQ